MTEFECEQVLKEYYFLQSEVGRYDHLAHGIKNWSITVGAGAIGTGFIQNSTSLFVVAAFTTLLFWATESRWKRFQHFHIDRIVQLEDLLLEINSKYESPQITNNIRKKFQRYKNRGAFSGFLQMHKDEITMALKSNTRQPHLVLFGAALFLTIFSALELL